MHTCYKIQQQFFIHFLKNQVIFPEESDLLSIMGDNQGIAGLGSWTPEQQIQELKRRMDAAMSQLMSHEKPSFKPNPDDVIVALPPKNGTTWMMHICHQIRMKGQEPDFEDQMDVISMIEMTEKLFGVDPAIKPQPASPRLYGTHLPYPLVPEGGKRIFSFRNQKDAVVSAYHFFDSCLALKGRVSLPIFARAYVQQIEKHIQDLVMWWEHRHDDDVLLLFFDDLKEDHAGCVRRIAQLMGVVLDEDAVARVVHTTSHAEMSQNASKFDTRKLVMKMTEIIGEEPPPEGKFVGRVRKDGGKSGEGKQKLPVEVQQRIDQMWQEIVTSKLGFQDLKEMREAWKKEQ